MNRRYRFDLLRGFRSRYLVAPGTRVVSSQQSAVSSQSAVSRVAELQRALEWLVSKGISSSRSSASSQKLIVAQLLKMLQYFRTLSLELRELGDTLPVLSSHLLLGLPTELFPSALLNSYAYYLPYPSHR
jgi:hypothetical protein